MKLISVKSFKVYVMTLVVTFLMVFCLTMATDQAFAENQAQLPNCVNSDCNCSDFTTQEAAQHVLDAFETDRFRLDGDKDGIACQSLRSSQLHSWNENGRIGHHIGEVFEYNNPYNNSTEYFRLIKLNAQGSYGYFPTDKTDNNNWKYLGTNKNRVFAS